MFWRREEGMRSGTEATRPVLPGLVSYQTRGAAGDTRRARAAQHSSQEAPQHGQGDPAPRSAPSGATGCTPGLPLTEGIRVLSLTHSRHLTRGLSSHLRFPHDYMLRHHPTRAKLHPPRHPPHTSSGDTDIALGF